MLFSIPKVAPNFVIMVIIGEIKTKESDNKGKGSKKKLTFGDNAI